MRLKRKIAPFIFGVSIGLLAGVGFFVFKINDWFDKLKANNSNRITVIQQPVKQVEKRTEKKDDSERFRIKLNKGNKVNYREVDSLIDSDSRINIATDELLSVKNVKAIRIDDNIAERDSSAAALANVQENEPDLISIEFWKTPLNSRGYRFSRNKLMLYGFIDFNVILYRFDGSYYLKSNDQVYRLFYGADFRQLEKVVDAELLAKIN